MKKTLLLLSLSAFLSWLSSLMPGHAPSVVPMTLQAQTLSLQTDVQLTAIPDHADWLYKKGEQAKVRIGGFQYGMPLDGVEVSYAIGPDCLPAQKTGTVTLHHGEATLNLGTLKHAGFMDCVLQCKVDGHNIKTHVKVGFAPQEIRPYTSKPKDFESFWKGVLDVQATVPMKPQVTYAPEYSSDKVDCYKVKLQCFRPGGYAIYGYLTKPKAPGKYPVLVSPPGAGIKPMNPMKTLFFAEQGIIRFDMEIHGIDPALSAEAYKEVSQAFGAHHANGYLSNGIENRDTYYMQKCYAACVRAVDYLVTLPEWDGKNVLLQGASQGGALGIILAALDPRITAASINHPALSDMAGYAEKGRTGGYPHFGNKYKGIELTPEVISTLAYYDVVNFATLVKCPVFMTWGYNDNTCPPTTSYAVWNTLTCPKKALLTPINEHWVTMETRLAQLQWLKEQCK